MSLECTCEESKIESLCNLIYADKQPALQKLQLEKICDFNFDLPGAFDEKYCSYELMYSHGVYLSKREIYLSKSQQVKLVP